MTSLLEQLQKIDGILHDQIQYLNEQINHLEEKHQSEIFESMETFNSSPDTSANGRKIWGKKGVYIFLITEDLSLTSKEIFDFNEKSLSGAKLKDIKCCSYLKGMCLYLGSSVSESLYSRLNQHFSSDYGGSSLHLGHKNRRFLLGKVEAYAFPIKKEYEPYLKIIIPGLETLMHDKFSPIAGSPRT